MKKSLSMLAVAAMLLPACDDPVVAEHIVDNFICTYMPWWMGDCQSQEVIDKVQSVLDHGFTGAHIRCEVQPNTVIGCSLGWGIKADILQDNSSIATGSISTGSNFTNFNIRNDGVYACVKNWSTPFSDGPCVGFDGSDFVLIAPSGFTCGRSEPYRIPIDDACMGFNLDAFVRY